MNAFLYMTACILNCLLWYEPTLSTIDDKNTYQNHDQDNLCKFSLDHSKSIAVIISSGGPPKVLTKSDPHIEVFYIDDQRWIYFTLFQMSLIVQRSEYPEKLNSCSASRDNWCTVGGDGGCRVGEVRAGTTSPMPDHKGFKLQQLVNCQKFSTLRLNLVR